MSLTSRVQRLITGPTPSVGSDDWPSRYIWRWICRRSAVATSVAAAADDRPPPHRDDRDQDEAGSGPAPAGCTAPPGCSAASARRGSARSASGHPRDAPGWGCRGCRRSAGRSPCRRRAGSPGPRPPGAVPPTPASRLTRSAGNRASPREASRATNRPTTPSSATISSDSTTPRIRAITGSRWELRSLRARRYAMACMREIPEVRGQALDIRRPARPRMPRVAPAAPGTIGPVRPGRGPRTGGTRTTTLLHCTTRNSRMPAGRTRSRG